MYLLDSSNVAGYVFNGDRVFDSEAVTLTLCPGFINQHSSIRSQAYIIIRTRHQGCLPLYACELTSEGEANMIIKHDNLPYSTWILQLKNGLFLDA